MGVMSLAKRPGGMTRLEDTCGRALAATPARDRSRGTEQAISVA